ncbi:MAG TPA: RDD family protein [Streptosporangiaceae bacterium]
MSAPPLAPPYSQPAGPDPAPGPVTLLRLRVAAAVIDIALMTAVFAALGFATGSTSTPPLPGGISNSDFGRVYAGPVYLTYGHVTLRAGLLAIYLVLLLAYFFVFELIIGATPGKLLTGLRVIRADGTRPRAGAVAVRTVLRLVDWLPAGYLAGFITAVASGERLLRLGDLAARTRVTRAGQAPGWLPLPTSLLLSVALILGLTVSVDSAGGPGTYRGHGVSFRYPAGWHQLDLHVTVAAGSSQELWHVAPGVDLTDLLLLESFRVNIPITKANITAVTPQVQELVESTLRQEGGSLGAGARQLTVHGLPAVGFRGTAKVRGTQVGRSLTFVFRGTTEYLFNCTFRPARAGQIERGCTQILDTFRG